MYLKSLKLLKNALSLLFENTIIGCLTVVLDREEIGDFEMPNIRSSHDMALWLSII